MTRESVCAWLGSGRSPTECASRWEAAALGVTTWCQVSKRTRRVIGKRDAGASEIECKASKE